MIIFVTGASVGFGAAIAKRFVREGHKVIGAARRIERLQMLQQALGDNFYPVELDVRDKQQIFTAINNLPEQFRSIDVLVNNAGLALGRETADQADLNDWLTMIETNITGLATLTYAVIPQMVAKHHGHIINIGSVAGNYPYSGGNVYGATKAFVKQFSLNLKAELANKNIRVTNIEPGLAGTTEFSNVRFKGNDAKAEAEYENVDALTADDIAEAVYWCATLPEHVNINRLEIMPTAQGAGTLTIHRKTQ